MKKSLLKKRALICGSTDGIGKATALMMADQGCEVILFARNKIKLKATLKELSSKEGQNHSFICADFDNTSLIKKEMVFY